MACDPHIALLQLVSLGFKNLTHHVAYHLLDAALRNGSAKFGQQDGGQWLDRRAAQVTGGFHPQEHIRLV